MVYHDHCCLNIRWFYFHIWSQAISHHDEMSVWSMRVKGPLWFNIGWYICGTWNPPVLYNQSLYRWCTGTLSAETFSRDECYFCIRPTDPHTDLHAFVWNLEWMIAYKGSFTEYSWWCYVYLCTCITLQKHYVAASHLLHSGCFSS